jgi:hypothetical protein
MIILPSGTADLWHMANLEDSVPAWCELAEDLSMTWSFWECAHPGKHDDVRFLADLALQRAKMVMEIADLIQMEKAA